MSDDPTPGQVEAQSFDPDTFPANVQLVIDRLAAENGSWIMTAEALERGLDRACAEVQRLTAENERLRELLQAFAISPEGVILRPDQAELYRSMADLYRPVGAETGETP